MPTYHAEALFLRQFAALTDEEKRLFRIAVAKFVADLKSGQGFRRGLRVHGVVRNPGEFEMTWAPDGRAVFRYGDSLHGDDPHVLWLRIGTHDVLNG